MVDLQTILNDHRPKYKDKGELGTKNPKDSLRATIAEIPDIFFDNILVNFKLSRIEIMVIMYLYRQVWCRANLYKEYGISQLMSHTEMAKALNIELDDVYHALRKLEELGFIETVRSGQYFVRKYFTRENDELFLQTYDDFEI